jgi:hypothetical protein
MGMYDVVVFTCPRCESDIEVQSKAGDCAMAHIDQGEVPIDIARSIEGETVECESRNCGTVWTVVVKSNPRVVAMGLAL